MNRRKVRKVLILGSAVLLAIGLVAPCMTVTPSLGESGVAAVFEQFIRSEMKPVTISILGGIVTLFDSGHLTLALIIFLFSVVFPVWKLQVLWLSMHGYHSKMQSKVVSTISKFSMTDVFVFAVLIMQSKSYTGTEVTLQLGLYAFACSALLSTALTLTLKKFVEGR